VGAWTGSSWHRIGTGGWHLWMRWWTFGFHKIAENFLTSWEPVSFSRRTPLLRVSKVVFIDITAYMLHLYVYIGLHR
jgi:hypothetical protein